MEKLFLTLILAVLVIFTLYTLSLQSGGLTFKVCSPLQKCKIYQVSMIHNLLKAK